MTLIRINSTTWRISDAMHNGLITLYQALDRDLSFLRPNCDACGNCCRFSEFDHQLWLTHIELYHLVKTTGIQRPVSGRDCPYLKNGSCSARSGRALGCRVFFCHTPLSESGDLHEKYLKKIRRLAHQDGIELYYGELLTSLSDLELNL